MQNKIYNLLQTNRRPYVIPFLLGVCVGLCILWSTSVVLGLTHGINPILEVAVSSGCLIYCVSYLIHSNRNMITSVIRR